MAWLAAERRWDEGVAAYEQAVPLDEALVHDDPANASYRRDAGVTRYKLAEVYKQVASAWFSGRSAAEKLAAARRSLAEYRAAAAVFRQLKADGLSPPMDDENLAELADDLRTAEGKVAELERAAGPASRPATRP